MNYPGIYRKQYRDDIDILRKDFGLTEEEIEGFIEFFDIHIKDAQNEVGNRVINTGPNEDK